MDKPTLISTVRSEIRARRGKLRELAKRSGVPYSTLVKIGQGCVRNPRIKTIEALLRDFGIVCAVPAAKLSNRGQIQKYLRENDARRKKPTAQLRLGRS